MKYQWHNKRNLSRSLSSRLGALLVSTLALPAIAVSGVALASAEARAEVS